MWDLFCIRKLSRFCSSCSLNHSRSRSFRPNSSMSVLSSVLFDFGVGASFRLLFNSFILLGESSLDEILTILGLVRFPFVLLTFLGMLVGRCWSVGCRCCWFWKKKLLDCLDVYCLLYCSCCFCVWGGLACWKGLLTASEYVAGLSFSRWSGWVVDLIGLGCLVSW